MLLRPCEAQGYACPVVFSRFPCEDLSSLSPSRHFPTHSEVGSDPITCSDESPVSREGRSRRVGRIRHHGPSPLMCQSAPADLVPKWPQGVKTGHLHTASMHMSREHILLSPPLRNRGRLAPQLNQAQRDADSRRFLPGAPARLDGAVGTGREPGDVCLIEGWASHLPERCLLLCISGFHTDIRTTEDQLWGWRSSLRPERTTSALCRLVVFWKLSKNFCHLFWV